VRSDTADEIHVHGYDLHKDARRGGSVSFDFPATIAGAFVVELESRGEETRSSSVSIVSSALPRRSLARGRSSEDSLD
jgi:hypothetical protein